MAVSTQPGRSLSGPRRAAAHRWACAVSLLAASCALSPAQARSPAALRSGVELRLWSGPAPGSQGLGLKEEVVERSDDPKRPDRYVQGITAPRLRPFLPKRANGAAMIVVPGGGYVREVLDKESFETARFLTSLGVTAFVLLHRLPGEGHAQGSTVPLQDAQRAMRLVRSTAPAWGLDPERIGVLGFSAGGHVASTLATQFATRVYEASDAADQASARPNFCVLLYPVISMNASLAHAGSRSRLLGASPTSQQERRWSSQHHVTEQTPPTLLVLTDDDRSVPAENGLAFYRALRSAGVSAEMHIYAQGGHGFGIRGAQGLPLSGWPHAMAAWLKTQGVAPQAPLGLHGQAPLLRASSAP